MHAGLSIGQLCVLLLVFCSLHLSVRGCVGMAGGLPGLFSGQNIVIASTLIWDVWNPLLRSGYSQRQSPLYSIGRCWKMQSHREVPRAKF